MNSNEVPRSARNDSSDCSAESGECCIRLSIRSNSVENAKACGLATVSDRFTHDKNSAARMNAMTKALFTPQIYEKNEVL